MAQFSENVTIASTRHKYMHIELSNTWIHALRTVL